jgi:hypothetical protein
MSQRLGAAAWEPVASHFLSTPSTRHGRGRRACRKLSRCLPVTVAVPPVALSSPFYILFHLPNSLSRMQSFGVWTASSLSFLLSASPTLSTEPAIRSGYCRPVTRTQPPACPRLYHTESPLPSSSPLWRDYRDAPSVTRTRTHIPFAVHGPPRPVRMPLAPDGAGGRCHPHFYLDSSDTAKPLRIHILNCPSAASGLPRCCIGFPSPRPVARCPRSCFRPDTSATCNFQLLSLAPALVCFTD